MALSTLRPQDVTSILKAVPRLVKLPAKRISIDYDDEADVLYLSFRRPQKASDSELREDGIIIHRSGKQIVGITVLDASTR
jgi:uncharacterized protein YuzE